MLHNSIVHAKAWTNCQLYLRHFILWAFSLLFDFAIIVSSWWIILILELNTLIEGRDLFCRQEYKYCLAVIKVWLINNSSLHLKIPNNINIFVRKVFYLYSLIIKPFYYLGPEILSITTTNKKKTVVAVGLFGEEECLTDHNALT